MSMWLKSLLGVNPNLKYSYSPLRTLHRFFFSEKIQVNPTTNPKKLKVKRLLIGSAGSLLLPLCLRGSILQTDHAKDANTEPILDSNNNAPTFTENDPRLKSHECMKNAAGLSVDSTSAVLSQTVYAIIKNEKEYIELIDVLIKLFEFQLQVLGFEKEEAKMADLILETRAEIKKVYQRKQDLDILFSSAEKLAEAAAEVAFMSGADYASTSIGERLHSAQLEIKRVRSMSSGAESRLRQAEARSVEAISQHQREVEKLSNIKQGELGEDVDIDKEDEEGDSSSEQQGLNDEREDGEIKAPEKGFDNS